MLGQLLERGGLELGIAQRLAEDLGAAPGQAFQPAAVAPLRGSLFAECLALLRSVERPGRERQKLFVAGEQFHLAVADLRRLLAKSPDLVVDPEGMIGGVHDDERRRRRPDPLPPRQVVLDERPHLHRLRRDAEGQR